MIVLGKRRHPYTSRCRPGSIALSGVVALVLASIPVLGVAADTPGERESPELRVIGMTFVGSRGSVSELVLRSKRATFHPDRDIAHLEHVRAVVSDDDDGDAFEMTCERAELNVKTNDFRAEGEVRGKTADGQHYSAPWVGYDHEAGLLHTSASVFMADDTGSFRGDGFRYHVRERRFQLLGNVLVEQNP
jgi:LPS export ABC transporter protein LptC